MQLGGRYTTPAFIVLLLLVILTYRVSRCGEVFVTSSYVRALNLGRLCRVENNADSIYYHVTWVFTVL